MGDPLISHVKLLCHCDGSEGGTTLADLRGHASTISGAYITAANAAVGFGQSLYNGGGANGASFASSSDFDLAGDFTIEFRARISSLGVTGSLLSRGVNGGSPGGWHIGGDGEGGLAFLVRCAAGSYGAGNYQFGSFGSVAVGGWSSYAVTRAGTTVRCYKNGVLISTNANSYSNGGQALNASAALAIGTGGYYGSTGSFQIDEIRVSDVARYTGSTYTVEAGPFSDTAVTYTESSGGVTASAAAEAQSRIVLPGKGTFSGAAVADASSGASMLSQARGFGTSKAGGVSGGTVPVQSIGWASANITGNAAYHAVCTGASAAQARAQGAGRGVFTASAQAQATSVGPGLAAAIAPTTTEISGGSTIAGRSINLAPSGAIILAKSGVIGLLDSRQMAASLKEIFPDEVWVLNIHDKSIWARTVMTN